MSAVQTSARIGERSQRATLAQSVEHLTRNEVVTSSILVGGSPLLARTVREGDCLIWQGAQNSRGYGSVTNGHGGSMLAHRAVWEYVNGPIPEGLTIDHVAERGCVSKLCLNVDHMEVVTRAENVRRALRARTHCKHGHELSGDNVRRYTRANGRVHRVCRACAYRWNVESRARREAGAA